MVTGSRCKPFELIHTQLKSSDWDFLLLRADFRYINQVILRSHGEDNVCRFLKAYFTKILWQTHTWSVFVGERLLAVRRFCLDATFTATQVNRGSWADRFIYYLSNFPWAFQKERRRVHEVVSFSLLMQILTILSHLGKDNEQVCILCRIETHFIIHVVN